MLYWSASTDWNNAGNGVLDAACDLGYNTNDVNASLVLVGVVSDLSPGSVCAPWSKQFGTTSQDYAFGLTADQGGSVYVVGETGGTLDGQTSAGDRDAFVRKYSANSGKVWTRQFGTASMDTAKAATTNAAGDVYVAGYTYGTLPSQTSAGGMDIFVSKYDGTGKQEWTRQLGTAASDAAYALSSDDIGNVYVAGYTGGALDGQPYAGSGDLFIVKYDANGNKMWTRLLGTSGYDIARAVTADSAGNIYVAGSTWGALDGQSNAGNYDFFVTKYTADGVKQWTRQFGTALRDDGNAITADSAGNIYVAGYTEGDLDGQSNAGNGDIFVTKYDSVGNKQWTRLLGTASRDFASALTSDDYGNVYVSGYTDGGLDGQTNSGGRDLFVTKYSGSGYKQWTRQLGTTSTDLANALASNGSDSVFVAGNTGGALDGQTAAGNFDAFVIKYGAEGTKQ